jgi:hypothetical protein
MEKGWTCIYVQNLMHKAEIVRAVLADQNIDSFMVDKRDSSYISVGDIEVYVRDEDAILAKLIIEQHEL